MFDWFKKKEQPQEKVEEVKSTDILNEIKGTKWDIGRQVYMFLGRYYYKGLVYSYKKDEVIREGRRELVVKVDDGSGDLHTIPFAFDNDCLKKDIIYDIYTSAKVFQANVALCEIDVAMLKLKEQLVQQESLVQKGNAWEEFKNNPCTTTFIKYYLQKEQATETNKEKEYEIAKNELRSLTNCIKELTDARKEFLG